MNAAVSAVFSFWPALKRPCGAERWPASQRRSSRSKRSISRAVAQDPAPVADEDDRREHADPDDAADQKCRLWTSGRRPTAIDEARQVEDEARSRAGRRRTTAFAQCSVRSVREKRRR